jgi:hypothetical protein
LGLQIAAAAAKARCLGRITYLRAAQKATVLRAAGKTASTAAALCVPSSAPRKEAARTAAAVRQKCNSLPVELSYHQGR